MLRIVAALSLMVGLSSAMVCLPEMCDSVTQPLLNCKGAVIKNGGFCGCTDVCAKVILIIRRRRRKSYIAPNPTRLA